MGPKFIETSKRNGDISKISITVDIVDSFDKGHEWVRCQKDPSDLRSWEQLMWASTW